MYFESIYDTLEQNQQRIPSDTPVKLITRHSIRFPITDPLRPQDASLTPEGICLAQKFGRCIRVPLGVMRASPVQRCVHTARCILEGYAETHPQALLPEIISDERLYTSYIADAELARQSPRKRTDMELLRGLCDRQPIPGHVSLETAVNRILDAVFAHETDNLPAGSRLDIYVTHDFQLVLLAAELLPLSVGANDNPWQHWPRMLEGMLMWGSRSNFHIAWRNTIVRHPLSP